MSQGSILMSRKKAAQGVQTASSMMDHYHNSHGVVVPDSKGNRKLMSQGNERTPSPLGRNSPTMKSNPVPPPWFQSREAGLHPALGNSAETHSPEDVIPQQYPEAQWMATRWGLHDRDALQYPQGVTAHDPSLQERIQYLESQLEEKEAQLAHSLSNVRSISQQLQQERALKATVIQRAKQEALEEILVLYHQEGVVGIEKLAMRQRLFASPSSNMMGVGGEGQANVSSNSNSRVGASFQSFSGTKPQDAPSIYNNPDMQEDLKIKLRDSYQMLLRKS